MHKSNSPTGLSTSLFFFTKETVEPNNQYHARMFCVENEKLVEDAATGSANGCLLTYLLKYQDSPVEAIVEQGFEMGRKSYILLNGNKSNESYQLKVGGQVQSISQGKWMI